MAVNETGENDDVGDDRFENLHADTKIELSEQSFDSKDLEELQVNKVHWSDIEAINRYGQTRDLKFAKIKKQGVTQQAGN